MSARVLIAIALLPALPCAGQTSFIRTYGLDTVADEAHCVIEAADGGFFLAGLDVFEDSTFNFAGSGVLLRTNAAGDELWRREYSVPGAQSVQFEHMIATADGHLVVAGLVGQGASDYDAYLAKLDTAGNVVWSTIIARPHKQWAYQARETPDHGIIATGWTSTTGSVNDGAFYMIKLGSAGDTLWTRTYPNPNPSWDQLAYCLEVMPDSGFILAGQQRYWSVDRIHLIRTDAQGDTLWTRTLDSLTSGQVRDVAITDAGNIIVTGYCGVTGFSEPFLAELDPSGNMLWSRIYDEVVAGWSYSVARTATGYALLVQDYSYDVILLDVALNGDLNWMQHYDVALDYPYSVEPTADGGFVMAGAMTPGGILAADIFLIKTDGSGIVSTVTEANAAPFELFPNPSTDVVTLRLPTATNAQVDVLDATGRLVRSLRMNGSVAEISVDDLLPGSYVVRVTERGAVRSVRMVRL